MAYARVETVGILTAGGDCPGLNAVLRAFVRTSARTATWKILGIPDGYEGLVNDAPFRTLDGDAVRGILPRGGTILGTSNRCNPFAVRHTVDGELTVTDESEKAVAKLRAHDVDVLVVVGGDGSLGVGLQLQRQYSIPVVGIPKTIDNDLSSTDITFGFDTAVATATDALDKLHSTAESHHRVMILEVMGRNAGWIALESGLAGGADIIVIPEIPFRVERIAEAILERGRRGIHFSMLVAAEGARPVGGEPILAQRVGPDGYPRLGGIGAWLVEQLSQHVGYEVRATVLGHLQRGGSPSPFDRVLASRLGAHAALLVGAGDFGKMVGVRGLEIVPVPIEHAVGVQKLVPPCGERVMTARHLGIAFGD